MGGGGLAVSHSRVWKVFFEDGIFEQTHGCHEVPAIQHCSGSWQKKEHFGRQESGESKETEKFGQLHPCEWSRCDRGNV